MHRLLNIQILTGYKLQLYFENGFSSEVDFEPFLQNGFARELLNKKDFDEAFIESGGGLSWKNGFDFCPNFLYDVSKKQTAQHA